MTGSPIQTLSLKQAIRARSRCNPHSANSHLPRFCTALGTLALLVLLCGCGGGGSSSSTPSTPPPPPPVTQPDYSLTFSPSSDSLQAGGAPLTVGVHMNPVSGAPESTSVTISFPNPPAGVTILPAQTAISDTSGSSFDVLADASVAAGNLSINVSSTDGNVTHSYTVSSTVTAPASFHLTLSPSTLSLTPGVPQTTQASIVADSGTAPSVGIFLSQLPGQQQLQFPSDLFPAGQGPFTVTVDTDVTAQPMTGVPVFVVAKDQTTGATSEQTLQVSVSVPFPPVTAASRSTMRRTGGLATAAVYDPSRKLVFAAFPSLNQVRVYSSTDANLVATIPVSDPSSVDETPDGSAVLVGGFEQVFVIDPALLRVTGRVLLPSPSPGSQSPFPAQVVALSTGSALVLTPADGRVFLWNPPAGTMTEDDPPGLTVTPGIQPEIFVRSGDRSRALLVSPQYPAPVLLPYDAATDSYGTPFAVTGQTSGLPGVAIDYDGSRIAVSTDSADPSVGGKLTFYDAQFQQLASLPGLNSDAMIYSLDGSTLYTFQDSTEGVAYNAQTFQPEGLFPLDVIPSPESPFAIDETGMIFSSSGSNFASAGANGSMDFIDAADPGAIVYSPQPPTLQFPDVVSVPIGVQHASPTYLDGDFDSNANYGVYLGPPPASPSTQPATGLSVDSLGRLAFQPPSPSAPGPVNVTVTRDDGWMEVIPDGFTYGPHVLKIVPDTLPPGGGTTVTIFGYGLILPNQTLPQVTIGGQPAQIVSDDVLSNNTDGTFPIDALRVTAPAGSPGLADVTITTTVSPYDTATVQGGIHYLQSADSYSATGTLASLVYDGLRQRLYAANPAHNQVEVFDLATKAFLAPIPVGNAPNALALTPDGAELAALNSGDQTVSVIDPGQLKVASTETALTAADQSCGAIQVKGLAAATPHRVLFWVACGSTTSGYLHALDLDTGSLSCSGIPDCDATGTNITIPNFVMADEASSADGNNVLLTGGSSIGLDVLLDLPGASATTRWGWSGSQTSASVDAGGTVLGDGPDLFLAGLLPASRAGILDFLTLSTPWLTTPPAEALNPSGSLLFAANRSVFDNNVSQIWVYDAHRGRLVRTIAAVGTLVQAPHSLAVDETGTKIFALTDSGIAIEQLARAPLSIATVSPAAGTAGSTLTIRGSGFQNGATLTFGSATVSATFVDSMTLTVTAPALAPGPVQVTVTNPDGSSYSYDAAFTAQ